MKNFSKLLWQRIVQMKLIWKTNFDFITLQIKCYEKVVMKSSVIATKNLTSEVVMKSNQLQLIAVDLIS